MRSSIRPGRISKMFITHLHGDHMFGLPGLMCTVSQTSNHDNKQPVDVYGPVGLRQYLRSSLALSRSQLGYQYRVHELLPLGDQYPQDWETWPVDHSAEGTPPHPNEEPGSTIEADPDAVWHVCEEGRLTVQAGWLTHKVPCFGYAIDEAPLPGKLDARLLKERGIPPGPLYARIKAGETVTAPDGQLISPSAVLGPPRPGRRVVVLGDTCDSRHMGALCQDADVLVHEATLEDEMEENAIEKGHSTPRMAGEFARACGVRRLVLTHFSQRYRPLSAELKEGEDHVLKLVEQAKDAFGANVVGADDFVTVAIPPRPLETTL